MGENRGHRIFCSWRTPPKELTPPCVLVIFCAVFHSATDQERRFCTDGSVPAAYSPLSLRSPQISRIPEHTRDRAKEFDVIGERVGRTGDCSVEAHPYYDSYSPSNLR